MTLLSDSEGNTARFMTFLTMSLRTHNTLTIFPYMYLFGKMRSGKRCSFHIYSCRTICWIFSNFVSRE